MSMTIKRAGSLAILAAGASSGVANAQILTDTFNFALDVTQPPATFTPQSFDVQIGSALGQLTPQYTFSNFVDPGLTFPVNIPPSTGAQLQGNGASTATDAKLTPQTSVTYGPGPFNDYPLQDQSTPLQFLIGTTPYTGTANFLYDAGAETFTLTTVDYQALAVPAVPEPATWAMLIGGFGAAGGALRASRRRKRQAAPLAA